MSKIKTNRLEPRANNGSLIIGNPESYTVMEGDVQIPAYATREYVQDVITGDIEVELEAYQKKDEKGYANGYVGLDANADIDMGSNKILTDSIELTGNRNINVAKDQAGNLLYDGDQKIKWGNLIDVFEDVNLRDNRITGMASPEDEDDAATKKYVDDSISPSARLGRKFIIADAGKSSTAYLPGDLFFTTENNAAYTLVFNDVRYVCFAWEDSDGMIWRTASTGSIALPSGHIIVEYQDKMMGWFDYEGSTVAMTDGTQTGSVVIPVTGWNATTGQSSITNGRSYELITQFWN